MRRTTRTGLVLLLAATTASASPPQESDQDAWRRLQEEGLRLFELRLEDLGGFDNLARALGGEVGRTAPDWSALTAPPPESTASPDVVETWYGHEVRRVSTWGDTTIERWETVRDSRHVPGWEGPLLRSAARVDADGNLLPAERERLRLAQERNAIARDERERRMAWSSELGQGVQLAQTGVTGERTPLGELLDLEAAYERFGDSLWEDPHAEYLIDAIVGGGEVQYDADGRPTAVRQGDDSFAVNTLTNVDDSVAGVGFLKFGTDLEAFLENLLEAMDGIVDELAVVAAAKIQQEREQQHAANSGARYSAGEAARIERQAQERFDYVAYARQWIKEANRRALQAVEDMDGKSHAEQRRIYASFLGWMRRTTPDHLRGQGAAAERVARQELSRFDSRVRAIFDDRIRRSTEAYQELSDRRKAALGRGNFKMADQLKERMNAVYLERAKHRREYYDYLGSKR